jgi:dihydrofolate reductase
MSVKAKRANPEGREVRSDAGRRLRYSVAMSLDGFIADENGGYGWITMDPEIDFAAYMAKIDTLIMGRGTYEVAGGGGPGFGEGTQVYVVSTTLDPAEHPRITVISRDVEKRVAELKAQPGKDIWLFGGGVLFRSLLEAGLVDRVEVGLMPVLLGQGVPLLPGFGGVGGKARSRLRLHSVEEMPTSGILLIKYDVER